MARIDDYKESFRLAALNLKASEPEPLARAAGGEFFVLGDGRSGIRLPFLGNTYLVRMDGETVDVIREGQETEVPLPERILLCHYLLRAAGMPLSGELITFRQVPDGHFYFDAFQRRARDPLLATFGRNVELFRACARRLGGEPSNMGDAAMSFRVLPQVPVQLVLWEGDDEFPPEANILFDASIQHRLSAEDIAVLAGMLVYRLMGIARTLQSEGS